MDSRFFAHREWLTAREPSLRAVLYVAWSKTLTIMAYHLQTSEQAENYSKTIVRRLPHVAEHQPDRDLFVQLLTFVYNYKLCHPIGMTTFSLVVSH